MAKVTSIRMPDALVDLIDQALAEIRKKTVKNVTVNELMVDAIEAYCKGVLQKAGE